MLQPDVLVPNSNGGQLKQIQTQEDTEILKIIVLMQYSCFKHKENHTPDCDL